MKIILLILLLSRFPGQEISVQNNSPTPLPKDHPVSLHLPQINTPFHITHRGIVIATQRGPKNKLWFQTQEIIENGKADTRYKLHRGEAALPPSGKVFPLFETFSGQNSPFQKVEGIPFLIRKGKLYLPEIPDKYTLLFPAKIPLNLKKIPNNFSFQIDFECAAESPEHAKYGVEILFERAKPVSKQTEQNVKALIAQLNSDSWSQREAATHELIRIGPPAETQVTGALKTKDAEVRWRAEYILKEIRSGSSWPGISAGFELHHPEIKPIALTWRIGPTANRMRYITDTPLRLHLEIHRDQNHYVTLSWNGTKQTLPVKLEGEVKEIYLYGAQSTPASSILTLDNILLRQFLDEKSRPTVTLTLPQKK